MFWFADLIAVGFSLVSLLGLWGWLWSGVMFLRLLCVSGLRYFGVWCFDLVVGFAHGCLVGFLLFSGVWGLVSLDCD